MAPPKTSFRIILDPDVLAALQRVAIVEERDIRVQAGRLIREALAGRGEVEVQRTLGETRELVR